MHINDFLGTIIEEIDDYFYSLDNLDVTVINESIGHYEFGSQKLYDKQNDTFIFNDRFEKEYDIPEGIDVKELSTLLAEEKISFNKKFYPKGYEVCGHINISKVHYDIIPFEGVWNKFNSEIFVCAEIVGEIKELSLF